MCWVSSLLGVAIIAVCLVPSLTKMTSSDGLRNGLIGLVILVAILHIIPSAKFVSDFSDLANYYEAFGGKCPTCSEWIARFVIGILL